MPQWSPQETANILWAFAKTQTVNTPLMDAAALWVLQPAHCSLPPRELATFAWSFASLANRRMPLFHCIGFMATASMQEFQAQSLANLVQTFAQVQLNCEPFFENMNVQVGRGICIDMEPQALANTAWALAHLQVVNDSIMASIEDGIRSRISEFQLQELASAIWAFGEMQLLDPPLFAAVYSASLDKGLKTADGSLAVMTLSALARLKDPKLALLCYSQLEDLGGSAKGLGPLLAQAELEEHKEQHAQGESDASAASVSVAPSDVLLQLRPATGHAAVTAAALHLAEIGEAAEALKLVEHLARSGQRGLWHQLWVACGGQLALHPRVRPD